MIAWNLARRPVALWLVGWAVAQTGLFFTATCSAQSAGRMIRVPVPISGNIDTQVRRSIRQVKATYPENMETRPILVLEFWPPAAEEEGAASEFERSLALARFLSGKELNGIRTVAYVPRSLSGHAVLPVIACEQIIMHPDATLGSAGSNEDNLSITVRGAYREISNRRRTIPESVALGMVDPELTVFRVETADGTKYVLQEEADELREQSAIDAMDTVIAAGDMGQFSGRELRLEHGFVSHLASDRRELAEALSIDVSSLEPDPAMGGDWRTIRLEIKGQMNPQTASRIQRNIEDRMRTEQTNFVLLDIDSPGGSPTASLQLAAFLSELDSSQVRTVAYVSHQALADSALIALACDHVVLNDNATIGGAGAYQPTLEEVADMRAPIKHVCEQKSKSWSLPVAMIDPDLVVTRYAMQGTGVIEHFCDEELEAQSDPNRWLPRDAVTKPASTLQLDANQADDLGVARYVVDGIEQLKTTYQLEDDLTLVEPNWADELVHQLSQPHVAGTLLFFAGFALIVELSAPGVGAGGFISAVCFSLFFWSQFLNGTANWLEIILFVLGLGCVALEIFVLPGMGIFGFGGAALIVASLVLASQTFILPQNEYQLKQLPWSLLSVVLVGAGVCTGLFVLRKYLDRAPILRRVMLDPPMEEMVEPGNVESPLAGFVDSMGETTTPLTPYGRARIQDDIIDVVSDGPAIEKGVNVKVVRVDGTKMFVRPA